MTRANIQTLKENGPTKSEEMPNSSEPGDKLEGMRKFDVGGKTTTPVYFLRPGDDPAASLGKEYNHDPKEVITAFLDVNPDLVENENRQTLSLLLSRYNSSNEWKEAVKNALDEHDDVADRKQAARV